MKLKKLMLMAMVAGAVCMCACGNTAAADTPDTTKQEETEKESETSETQGTEEVVTEQEENSLLPNTYKVSKRDIYVDVPDMHPIESAFTQIWYEDEVKYVTFTCVKTETAADEKEALDIVFDRFVSNMEGYDTINEMGKITEEYLEINGIKTYAFEGTMSCGDSELYDAYVKGYSFIYDGLPCAIIGAVKDREQPQEQIDVIKEIVDAMILTVRSEQ